MAATFFLLQARALFAHAVALVASLSLSACEPAPLDPPAIAEAAAPVPGERSATGTLKLVMVSDGTTALPEYHLAPDGGARWWKLAFDRRHDLVHQQKGRWGGHEHLGLPGGTRAFVRGVLDADNVLHVIALDPVVEAGATSSSSQPLVTPGPRKVLVILANFRNNRSRPLSVEDARWIVFGAWDGSNAHFQESSWGAVSLEGKYWPEGDVVGWYQLPIWAFGCDYVAWGDAARAAAVAEGVDLSGYDHIVHYFPGSYQCSWTGIGLLPGDLSWINGTSAATITHEIGHNLGLHHASSLSCWDGNGQRVSVGERCTYDEYGDPFDVMGKTFRHQNVFNKGRLGWLLPENTYDVNWSGTFRIEPLEWLSIGIKALRVPLWGTGYAYYIESRRPWGFDGFGLDHPAVNGVLVHFAPDNYDTIDRTHLLDMTPWTTSFEDAALGVGQTFSDSNNIDISVNEVTPDGATVTVTRR